MTEEQRAELEKLARAATPGPWAWMGSPSGLYLSTTHSGRKYVMGFRRMGMQGAQPVFRISERLVPASDLVTFQVGDGVARGFAQGEADPTVYRRDVSGIDAPDARFIAAANPATVLNLLATIARLEAEKVKDGEALEAITALGSDGEHSGDRHAQCRQIARARLSSRAKDQSQ